MNTAPTNHRRSCPYCGCLVYLYEDGRAQPHTQELTLASTNHTRNFTVELCPGSRLNPQSPPALRHYHPKIAR